MIVVVSLALNGWGLAAMGWGNAYYAAAVRSMGSSWHSVFFASFDSGGYVSVDKPPFALWVQVVSSKLFGYSQLSLLVPEVLAGTATVWLLFWGVRRSWGVTAGLIAAAVLAVTPITVVVAHSNNTDPVLVLLMTAAAVTVMEAIRTGRLRWFVLACALAGCAMTTKMLAAAPVMPGILVAFGWCSPTHWRPRIRQFLIGALTMATVGMWWFVAVQATPPSDRPYVGSTQTNSVFELAFERNGVNQVDGEGTPGFKPRRERPAFDRSEAPADGVRPASDRPATPADFALPGFDRSGGLPFPIGGNARRGGPFGLGFTSGTPGVTRLLNRELGAQVGWMVPFAVIGALLALWSTRLRRSPRLGALVVLGCWFGAGAIVFSFTRGIVHPYYMSALAPPLAGLVGAGAATVRFDLEAGRRRVVIGLVAIALTGWAQWTIWRRFDWNRWVSVFAAIAVATVITIIVVAWLNAVRTRTVPSRRRAITGIFAVVAALLIAPIVWTVGSLRSGVNGPLPFAQPVRNRVSASTGNQITPNGGFQFPSISVASLVAYLEPHRAGERWDLAVQSAGPAEELIITSGQSVMAIGGFVGSDPIATADQLRAFVRNGELRYFLLSTGSGGGLIPGLLGLADNTTWVADGCRVVSSDVWEHGASQDTARPGTQAFPGGPTAAAFQLYDCRGFRSAAP